MQEENATVAPFLKWAGGKRWLISAEPQIFPETFNRYIEPFLGSGAVYFHLKPKGALLSDSNPELIDTYNAIRANHHLVLRYLKEHQKNHCKDYYYKVRTKKTVSIYTRAARFLYLNRTCWNGLYRVNLKGEFNVPIGTKNNVLMDIKNFPAISSLLKSARIMTCDFAHTLDQAQYGDFVFVDPPYTVKHNNNGFIKYNETLFSWDDQIRLKKHVDMAAGRGAKVLVLNAAHKSVKLLYRDYNQKELSRKSVLSGNPLHRGKFKELAIKSWK